MVLCMMTNMIHDTVMTTGTATSMIKRMVTLPSPLALLTCAMLVGSGARDLMGAATSPAGSGARFTKSFLSSAKQLDLLSSYMKQSKAKQREAQQR